jgi:hypothetical protein
MDKMISCLVRGGDMSTVSKQDSTGASLQQGETDTLIEDDCAMVSETLQTQLDTLVIRMVHGDETPAAYVVVNPPSNKDLTKDLAVDTGLLALGVKQDSADLAERYGREIADENPETRNQKPDQTTAENAYNPLQARNPKGVRDGGKWVKQMQSGSFETDQIDADYLAAGASSDLERARGAGDETPREDVKRVRYYHGSNVKFKDIDPTKDRSRTGSGFYGIGSYWTGSKEDARIYGPHILSKTGMLKKPVIITDGSTHFGVMFDVYDPETDPFARATVTSEKWTEIAKREGHDGVIRVTTPKRIIELTEYLPQGSMGKASSYSKINEGHVVEAVQFYNDSITRDDDTDAINTAANEVDASMQALRTALAADMQPIGKALEAAYRAKDLPAIRGALKKISASLPDITDAAASEAELARQMAAAYLGQ